MTSLISQEQTSSRLLAVPAEERTMYITISRGYPVAHWEVTNFLIAKYGNCVESIHMQTVVGANKHPLCARVVFSSTSTIDEILNGAAKVKFHVNRKHVWMRRHSPQSRRVASTNTIMPILPFSQASLPSLVAPVKSCVAGFAAAVFSCFKPAAN